MRPKERRDSGQSNLFKARLDQIVDMGPPGGEARRDDRLAVPRAVRGSLFRQAGPAAAADKEGLLDPEAHAQPVWRGAFRALDRKLLHRVQLATIFSYPLPLDLGLYQDLLLRLKNSRFKAILNCFRQPALMRVDAPDGRVKTEQVCQLPSATEHRALYLEGGEKVFG
jgi:hypothetical protein